MTTPEAATGGGPPALRTMVDSAYPLHAPPRICDIVLIYAGGDTIHPWTPAEIATMPERWRWPCFVRSNPAQCDPSADAGWFIHWLAARAVPRHTCVILDLETAVDATYVNAFNAQLRTAGYLVTKYGSQDFIWQNPKTDGGTFLALPGPAQLTGEGDEVARQYGFEGGYDLSVVLASLPLWDTRPPHQSGLYEHVTGGHLSLAALADAEHETPAEIIRDTVARDDPAQNAALGDYLNAAMDGYGARMPAGLRLWLRRTP